MADRADGLVVAGVFELIGMVREHSLVRWGQAITSGWAEANPNERRDALREVVERVVLVPRPRGNPHGKGQRHGRFLKLMWARPCSEDVFGYTGASSVLGAGADTIMSPKGKTWAEWNRQLRGVR